MSFLELIAILSIAILLASFSPSRSVARREGEGPRRPPLGESEETRIVRELRIARANLVSRIANFPKANFREPRTKALLFLYLSALEARLVALGRDPTSDDSYRDARRHRLLSFSREIPEIREEYLD